MPTLTYTPPERCPLTPHLSPLTPLAHYPKVVPRVRANLERMGLRCLSGSEAIYSLGYNEYTEVTMGGQYLGEYESWGPVQDSDSDSQLFPISAAAQSPRKTVDLFYTVPMEMKQRCRACLETVERRLRDPDLEDYGLKGDSIENMKWEIERDRGMQVTESNALDG